MGVLGVRKKLGIWKITLIDNPRYLRNYRTVCESAYTVSELVQKFPLQIIVGARLIRRVDDSELKAFTKDDVQYPDYLL